MPRDLTQTLLSAPYYVKVQLSGWPIKLSLIFYPSSIIQNEIRLLSTPPTPPYPLLPGLENFLTSSTPFGFQHFRIYSVLL